MQLFLINLNGFVITAIKGMPHHYVMIALTKLRNSINNIWHRIYHARFLSLSHDNELNYLKLEY